MKCNNFLCYEHNLNDHFGRNCNGMLPDDMKNCQARKRYNRIFKDMRRHANNYPVDKFDKERNKYHGRK